MAWVDDLDLTIRTVRDTFGVQATAALVGEAEVSVVVVLDHQYVEEALGGGEVLSTIRPVISVRDADLPRRPRKGDSFLIGQDTYRVEDAQEDSSGMTRCICVRL